MRGCFASIQHDRLIDLHHVSQFGFPQDPVRFHALQADLTLQLRIRFSDPDHAAEGLAFAPLDGDDFSRFFHVAQARDPGAVLGNIVSAGNLETGLLRVVPVGDANGKGDMQALVLALWRCFGGVLLSSGCAGVDSSLH